MAFTNVTRIAEFCQKKHNCQAVIQVDSKVYKEFNAAGNYLVANLPPEAVVVNAYVHTLVASDAGAVTLGTTEGGSEIMSAGASITVGESGTFTGQVATGTGVPLYMSIAAAATEGDFVVVVDYLEYTKNTGEYTRIKQTG